MAYHTIVVINNDEFSIIQDNPAGFVEAIRNGMRYGTDDTVFNVRVRRQVDEPNIFSFPSEGHLVPAEDDVTDLVVIYKGKIESSYRNADTTLRALAKKLGYNVVKKLQKPSEKASS